MTNTYPKVFISYSHDSLEHEDKVLAFANQLRTDGIDATIDQFEPFPKEGWLRWMERQIQEADFVLMVCTKTYLRRAQNKEIQDRGRGVLWEANLVYNILYNNKLINKKFISVVFYSRDIKYIPTPFKAYTYYNLSSKSEYKELFSRLSGQTRTKKQKLHLTKKYNEKDRNTLFPKEKMAKKKEIHSQEFLEITVNIPFKRFNEKHEKTIGKAICRLLNIGEITIHYKRKGSTKLGIELTQRQAKRLRRNIQQGKLASVGIIEGKDISSNEYWRQFYDYWSEYVWKWAYHFKHDDETWADDVTQESVLAIKQALIRVEKKHQTIDNLHNWAHRIAVRIFIAKAMIDRKRLQREALVDQKTLEAIVQPESSESLLKEDTLFWKEKIVQAMNRLTPYEYQIVRLLYWENKKISEIADQMGKSNGFVYDRKNKALKKLQKMLGNDWDKCFNI